MQLFVIHFANYLIPPTGLISVLMFPIFMDCKNGLILETFHELISICQAQVFISRPYIIFLMLYRVANTFLSTTLAIFANPYLWVWE